MPEPGNDPRTAAELAAQLLHGAGLNEGRVLFVADAFPRSAQATVAHTLAGARLGFSLLAVGTAQGAPVPLPDGGFLRDPDGGIRVPESILQRCAMPRPRRAGALRSLVWTTAISVTCCLPKQRYRHAHPRTRTAASISGRTGRRGWLSRCCHWQRWHSGGLAACADAGGTAARTTRRRARMARSVAAQGSAGSAGSRCR
jgi:hypothetical protein